MSLRTIARALGRAPSTISRELRRNALDSGAYRPQVADGAYMPVPLDSAEPGRGPLTRRLGGGIWVLIKVARRRSVA